MRSWILKILLPIVFTSIVIVVIILGGKISSVIVTGDFVIEPQLKITAENCLNQFKGKSFWLLPDKLVHASVLTCDGMFVSSETSHGFPGKLLVFVEQIHPLVKIQGEDKSCVVLESSVRKVKLPVERCSLFMLPLLQGSDILDNVFVQDFAVSLIGLLKQNEISISSLELSGDKIAPWYHVKLDNNVNVLFPSSANVKEKVATLRASITGLNTAKERYSTIDLRFDMVTYK